MKLWQSAVVGVALFLSAGCRTDPAIPILERELMRKDDEINRLRGQLEDIEDSASCQAQPVRGPRLGPMAEPLHVRPGTSAEPAGAQPPNIEVPGQPSSGVPNSLKVPDGIQGPSKPFKTGRLGSPGADADGPMLERGGIGSRRHGVTMASQATSAEAFTPSGDSRRVAAIALNRTLTGGIGAADTPGDQGLLVVVEPRDRAGRSVDAPADMSVVVMDPAIKGEAARVARWDFSAADTAGMFRRMGSAGAIHLTMTWPGDPPAHHKLQVYVRYVTNDGRKLNTDAPIEVALPGDQTARWKPGDFANESRDTAAAQPFWRQNERPAVRDTEALPAIDRAAPPPLQVASRPEEPKPNRPVWSPDRR